MNAATKSFACGRIRGSSGTAAKLGKPCRRKCDFATENWRPYAQSYSAGEKESIMLTPVAVRQACARRVSVHRDWDRWRTDAAMNY